MQVAPSELLQPSHSIRVTLSESLQSESLHPRRLSESFFLVLFPSPFTVNQSILIRVALSESPYPSRPIRVALSESFIRVVHPSRSIRVVSERRAHRTSTMTHDERAGSTAGGTLHQHHVSARGRGCALCTAVDLPRLVRDERYGTREAMEVLALV